MKRRPRTVLPAPRACGNCQRRKTRCSGSIFTGQPCTYCARASKPCSFEEPPQRTPLTRKNLDAAERRCEMLRSLLRSLNPGVDIQAALEALESPLSSPPPSAVYANYIESRDSGATEELNEYEWSEAPISSATWQSNDGGTGVDGMANLLAHKSGYLGSSSGSTILQEITSLLPIVNTSEQSSSTRSDQSRPPTAVPFDYHPDSSQSALLDVSIDEGDQLINAYFANFNKFYPILHERTFRDRAASWRQISSNPSWRIVYYMVLALGHWTSVSHSDEGTSKYYAVARANFSIQMLESGTIETVQAFILMGYYLQRKDRPNTSYNFLGVAYRMALGLGLHREIADSKDVISYERRRQMFWIMYCWDTGFSMTTGRPPIASDPSIDARLPRNIDDLDCRPDSPVPDEVDCPTTYSAVIAHAELARYSSAIYQEFLSAKTAQTEIDYQFADNMERTLANWKRMLPSYFRAEAGDVPSWFLGPRAVLGWREQNLRILLWRGSKQRDSYRPSKADARQRGLDVGMQTIHDIDEFCHGNVDLLHRLLSWYATYFLFQAALALQVNYLNREGRPLSSQTPVADEAWEVAMSKSRATLELLGLTNNAANRCLDVLDKINRSRNSVGDPRRMELSNCDELDRSMAPLAAHMSHSQGGDQGFDHRIFDPLVQEDVFGELNWPSAADPTLHNFLGISLEGVLNGVEGFPGTLERQTFDYIPGPPFAS